MHICKLPSASHYDHTNGNTTGMAPSVMVKLLDPCWVVYYYLVIHRKINYP